MSTASHNKRWSPWITLSKTVNLFEIGWTVIEKSRPEHDPKWTRLCDLLPTGSRLWHHFQSKCKHYLWGYYDKLYLLWWLPIVRPKPPWCWRLSPLHRCFTFTAPKGTVSRKWTACLSDLCPGWDLNLQTHLQRCKVECWSATEHQAS